MEILQSTAKMQQSQMNTVKVAQTQSAQSVQDIQKTQIHQEKLAQQETSAKSEKVGSQEQMDKLIDQLNRSLDPFSTSLRFGFDNTSDDFYVSVIDTQRNQVLRRFPLEQAEQLLPKMQEVTGLLFDHKG
ncbi:MAG: flagellar protein FlaG [Pseudomonadota bacterium]